jgi:hypothetical protein
MLSRLCGSLAHQRRFTKFLGNSGQILCLVIIGRGHPLNFKHPLALQIQPFPPGQDQQPALYDEFVETFLL